MGSFYRNALVTAPVEEVVATLATAGYTGLAAAAAPGLTVVYPHDGLDVAGLSRDLDAAVLAAEVNDSDDLWLRVWVAGGFVHEYCNEPTCYADDRRDIGGIEYGLLDFGADGRRWFRAGPTGVAAEPFLPFALGEPDTAALLGALSNHPADPGTPTYEDGYLLSNHLHWDAMSALGLPGHLLTTGYDYLTRADEPGADYSVFVPFGTAVRPDPMAPVPEGMEAGL